ncbi:MAG: hypothetical protein II085_03125 [Alphaproteobacteria bacterium]|nr:hypothetical protein [Alphaproteobacteria bacterium]
MNISKISFTGIDRFQIGRHGKPKVEEVTYTLPTGEKFPCKVKLQDYVFCAKLTDDFFGDNYSDLLLAVTKSGKSLNTGYFENNPQRIELSMTQGEVLYDEGDVFDDEKDQKDIFNCGIKLNGQVISTELLQPQCLPLYECLANLLKQFKLMFILNPDQKSIVNEMSVCLDCIVKDLKANR